jgi:putative flippase GtrA
MYETVQDILLRRVGEQKTAFIMQFVRYFGVALVGLLVDFATLVFVHEMLHTSAVVAASAGFLAGIIVNYLLSVAFVFKNSKVNSKLAEFGLFCLVGLIGLGILSLLMWLLSDVWGIYYIVAKCLATVVVYVWNFVGRKALYND